MDFSKALNKAHGTEVTDFYNQLKAKLSNPNWVAENNIYLKDGFKSNNVSIVVELESRNAIFIASELKQRFDSEGWRVLTYADDSKMRLTFNK